MYNFNVESQGGSTYLVYQIREGDNLDSLSLGMITNNEIKGIAPIYFTQVDANKYLKYNITAKVPVSKLFAGSVTRKWLLGVFTGIADAILLAEEYMIDSSLFVIDLDYIFVDVSTLETFLICLPIGNTDIESVNIFDFFKQVVFKAQYDQTENTDYVTSIVNYLNRTASFSLSDFSSMLTKQKDDQRQVKPVPSVVQPPVTPTIASPSEQPVAPPVKPVRSAAPASQMQGPVIPAPKTQPQAVPIAPKQPVKQPFAIPGASNENSSLEALFDPSDIPEKEISWFYLMQHYNKENKALYEAQKARKKARKKAQKLRKGQPSASPPGEKKSISFPGQGHSQENIQTPAEPGYRQPATRTQSTPAVHPPLQPHPAADANTDNFGGTVVLNSGTKKSTTILGVNPSAQNTPHLIRIKNNKRINISNLLRMGRDKNVVDYCIGENEAVSSYHADFTLQDGECYVTDMNSTNHTYVNGVMIQSMKPVKLSHGEKIKLANEEFEFKRY